MQEQTPPPTKSQPALPDGASAGRPQSLLEELRSMLSAQAVAVRQKWQRSLPLGDYVVDRWQKARDLGFGEGSSIYDSSVVLGEVKVGRNTWIGPFTMLDGSGGLEIGDYCSISAGVQIYTHDSVLWAVSGGTAEIMRTPTRIGDRCYLAPNVIVARGVAIGSGCVIGANSVVLESIQSGMLALGNPCRPVGPAPTA